MNHVSELERVATVQPELADRRPFGNTQHINDLNDRLVLHRLSVSEGSSRAAAKLMAGLRGLSPAQRHYALRDPLLRIGVDQALLHSKGLPARHSVDWTERLLGRAAKLLERPDRPTLIEAGQPTAVKTGSRPLSPLLWDDSNSHISLQSIEELVHEIVPDAHIDRPTEANVRTLQAAVKLLEQLLPLLAPSALNHATSVILLSECATPGTGHRSFQSSTARNLPGMILLSSGELATPWRAAEALLHESLHLKFIDLEFTHSMDLQADDALEAWTIQPPWHTFADGEGWHPIRAMTAAHVYLGLNLLSTVGQYASYDDGNLGYPSATELQDAAQSADYRARFLLDALEQRIACLGLAGQHFVKWLKALVSPEAPSLHREVCDERAAPHGLPNAIGHP